MNSFTLHVFGRVVVVCAGPGCDGIDVSELPRIVDITAEICEDSDPQIFTGAALRRIAADLTATPLMIIGPGWTTDTVIEKLQKYCNGMSG